jgi:hypothetical protein
MTTFFEWQGTDSLIAEEIAGDKLRVRLNDDVS